MAKRFRVAFSFAGEKRGFVEQVAAILAARFREEAVLYDRYHEAEFSRSDLAFYLPDLYEKEASLVVAVFCPDYETKEWCGLEWSAIFGLIKTRQVGEVMLTRFGRVEGKGLRGLAGYSDLDDLTPEQTAHLILERLALNEDQPKEHYFAPLRPSVSETQENSPVSHGGGRQVECQLNCLDSISDVLHARNSTFIVSLCNYFPQTEFQLSKVENTDELAQPTNMKSQMDLMIGTFRHGDILILETFGKLEVLASASLKIALENLEGYCDEPAAVKERIFKLIDEASSRIYDPDLDDLEELVKPTILDDVLPPEQERRFLSVINDRLHDLTLPMIPLLVRHFASQVRIYFELADRGIYSFAMGAENEYELDKRILHLDIPVGTRITIIASGPHGDLAGAAIKNVLENLWQCDQWLRSRARDWDSEATISDLLKYAKEMARHSNPTYRHVQNPFISNLIKRNVYVNSVGQRFTKDMVIAQLAEPHANQYNLLVSDIVGRVVEVESKQTVVPRPGFAIAHAAMDRSPRISISFGTYPDGVTWSQEHDPVKLVAMVICAHDTYRTWRDYLRRFSILFRSAPNLQSRLVAVRTSEEFVTLLKSAEISLAKL